jgi:hypothetical protein
LVPTLRKPYPFRGPARFADVTASPISLAQRLELVATARWSWSTYRHLGRRDRFRRAPRDARRAA